MANSICTSCKKNVSGIAGTTHFSCPKCAKSEITRCGPCRKIVVKYTCSQCGFEGPN